MRKSTRVLLVLASALLLALPLMAQTQTGTIAGTVVDTNGSPLPGVTVEVKSPELQGSRIAVTRSDGTFRLAALPPGTYSVHYRLEGFSPVDESNVAVRIATETQRRVTMSAGIKATITVKGQSVVVDTTKSTVDTHVDWKLMDSLPNGRNFQNVMQLAPGVSVNQNNPHVNGGSNYDNQYLIDGVDTTDPRTQTWGTQINYDSIAEVQVQTAGMSAEYGRVVGGLVNLVTKSGGNEFHGTVRVIRNEAGWTAKPKPGHGAATGSTETHPEATLGGPIVKDRLWFFLAGERRDRAQLFNRETGDGTGVYNSDTSTYKGHYLSGKFTLQATPSNSLVAYYNEDPIDISNVWGRYYLGPSVSPRTESLQHQGAKTYSLNWTSIFNPSTYLEAKAHSYSGQINLANQAPLGPDPTTLDAATGYWSGTTLEGYFSTRRQDGAQVALSKFLDTNLGSHQIKAGIQYLGVKNTVQDVYYPSGGLDGTGYLLITAGPTYLQLIKNYNRAGKLNTKDPYYAIYAQDSWQSGNLTVNYGLRAEQVSLKNNVGQTVVKFGFGKQIAPRLGFAYDLHGNSLHGSASRFYDTISDYVTADFNVDNERQSVYVWAPNYGYACSNPSEGPSGNVNSDCWIQVADYGLVSSNRLNPNLKPGYTDEATLGYDQRLTDNMSAGITYVWRQQKDVVESYDSGTNGDLVANDGSAYITNVPGAFKKYQALQLSLHKRYSEDRIQFITSWTHSFKNEGFDPQDKLTSFGNCSVCLVNRYGKLDTPDLFKFDGSYTQPWGSLPTSTTFGISAYYYTGPYWIQYKSVSLPTGTFDQYVGRAKVGNQWDIDLHIQQDIAAWSSVKFSLYADFFNLTNNQDPTLRQGNIASPSYGAARGWQTPRRYQIGAKIQF